VGFGIIGKGTSQIQLMVTARELLKALKTT